MSATINQKLIKKIVVLSASLMTILGTYFSTPEAKAQQDGDLAGIYVGSMHLVDGYERDIPLSISLVLTDETISTPGGLEYMIDGAFVVDDEGGPYTFTRVSYDIDNNRLDMKYSRPRLDPSTTAPATLRLVGGLDGQGGITGKVNSGIYGPIGTFTVKRNESLVSLPYQLKYIGTWSGRYKNVRFNSSGTAEVTLQHSSKPSQNPPGMEFDFTPGRSGGYSYNGVWITSFGQVVIDYLRRKVVMSDPEDLITMELLLDFDRKTAKGQQTSSQYGLTAIFDYLFKIQ